MTELKKIIIIIREPEKNFRKEMQTVFKRIKTKNNSI